MYKYLQEMCRKGSAAGRAKKMCDHILVLTETLLQHLGTY